MTEPKALKDMTWEEATPIYEAFHSGKRLQFCEKNGAWEDAQGITLRSYVAYRIKQTKPSLNWDHLRPEIICAARDEDGEPHGFEETPYIFDGIEWMAEEGKQYEIECIASYDPGTCHWTESKIYRPGHDPK